MSRPAHDRDRHEPGTVDWNARSLALRDEGRFSVRRRLLQLRQPFDTGYAQKAKVDVEARTITLTRPDSIFTSRFAFEQPDAWHLVLDGEFEGRRIHMETHLFDRQQFPLVNRGFHWIQEYPFNR